MTADNSPNKPQAGSNLEEIRATRIEKVAQIKELGLNPYGYKWESSHHATELQEKYRSQVELLPVVSLVN